MKKALGIILSLAILLSLCAPAVAEQLVKIDVWYCLSGVNASTLMSIADQFNASQSKYAVEFMYAGSYNDALTKYLSTPAMDRPDMICVNALGMRPVIDDGGFYHMQKLVDGGKFDTSEFPGSLIANFSNQDGLYAMVLNLTIPVLSYNKTYLERIGCTVDDLKTWEGVGEVADKMVEAGLCSYGFGFCNDTWIIEQMIGMLGHGILDNNNGRDGYATKLSCTGDGTLLQALTTVDTLLEKDSCFLAASASSARDDCSAGVIGMYCTTAGTWGDMLVNSVDGYEYGQTPLPCWDTESEYFSPYPSGAGMFIVDKGDMDRIDGACEFINWFCTDAMQLEWCQATGYLPIKKSVLNSDAYQAYVTAVNPGIQACIEAMFDQSRGTDPHFGSLSEWRVAVQTAMSTLDTDGGYTPEKAVEEIAANINDAIDLYNLSNY